MNNNFEETDDFEETETPDMDIGRIEIPTSRGRGNSEDAPVANAGAIPFFSDADKRGTNTAAYLKITKIAGEGTGYKGQLPLSSTEETIHQSFADGTYNIDLMNHKHKVLRSRENVKISLGAGGPTSRLNTGSSSDSDLVHKHLAFTLQQNAKNHAEELTRQERISSEVTKQVIANAQSHASIVTATTEASANREREFLSGMIQQQQSFFGNMILMMQNSFTQTMTLLTTGHTMTMEQLRASNERDAQQNNPMLMLQLFREGINLGKEFDGDNEPEYLKAIGMGVKGLSELKALASMRGLPSTTSPGTSQATNTALVTPPPKGPSIIKNPSTPTTPTAPKEKILSKNEILETVRLKEVLRKRGIDFESMLKQASEHYDKASDEEIFNNSSEDNKEELEETSDDSDSTTESNVES